MMKTIFILFATVGGIAAVIVSVRVFLSHIRYEKYQHMSDYANQISGLIAERIGYMDELKKICAARSSEINKNHKHSYYDDLFGYFYKKDIISRIQIEKSTAQVKSRLGNQSFKLITYFILLGYDMSVYPEIYCQQKQINWRQVKTMQFKFTRVANSYVDKVYKHPF